MNKLSSADVLERISEVPGMLRQAAGRINTLEDEVGELREKVAEAERNTRATSIIQKMESRGQDVEGSTMEEKVASLLGNGADLEVLDRAVELTSPDGSFVQLGDTPSGGMSDFEAYILGDKN